MYPGRMLLLPVRPAASEGQQRPPRCWALTASRTSAGQQGGEQVIFFPLSLTGMSPYTGMQTALALGSLPGTLGRVPEAIADDVSCGYVDYDREAAVVGHVEGRSRHKRLDHGGACRRRHPGAHGLARSRH